jgi:flagellar hook-length control protein FliK
MLFDESLSEEAEWLRLSEKLLAEKSARQGVMGSKSDARFAQVLADRSDLSRQSEPKVDSQIRFSGALSFSESRVNAERNDMPPIPSTLRHVDWGKSLTQRVSLMVGQKLQSAEIQLNPRNLGPMEVQLSIQQDQASVIFSSQHAVVREAIESALPKLREMLEEMGIQLDNVDVRQEYSEPNDAHKEPVFEKNRSSLQKEIEDSDSGVDKLRVGRTSTLEVNLVDYYA